MFIEFNKRYINTSQIKSLRPLRDPKGRNGHWAEIELIDGQVLEGYLDEEKMQAFTQQFFPSPPGFELLDLITDETPVRVRRETVVAFAYSPGSDGLIPITAENGMTHVYALKTPSGEVCTGDELFPSEGEFIISRTRAQAA